ncbi:MAG: hypothetical protein JWM68_626 [Verrucomicrobiales bacterium]|nr:hypothetical protein [Verrucomicrobiales bacterium]
MVNLLKMNAKIFFCLAVMCVGFNLTSQARLVHLWSESELQEASDLIVIGSPIGTKDLDETNSLGWSQSASFRPRFRGLETTFKVLDSLKGMPANDRIVLHHYRNEIEWGSPPNAPNFISFTPNETNQLMLYLIADGTNRYAPVTGQIDPSLSVGSVPTNRFGYPLVPPIATANPSIRLPLVVHVPAGLKIVRTAEMLSVEVDESSLTITNLMVGTNMVTGVQSELYVYPEDERRPATGRYGLGGFNLGTSFLQTKPDGIPLPGKKYIVEMELKFFETDIPWQHMWHPQGSKKYKVLWQRTLKQIVE